MTVLATSRSDIGPDVYDLVIDQLGPVLQDAVGFQGHFAGADPDGGWSVIEVWDTAEQQAAFYDEFVRPNLPEGAVDAPAIRELHNAMLASSGVAK
jgi:hypothetical protein